jgi:hypothetical protein
VAHGVGDREEIRLVNDDPARLPANAGKSFVGSYVLGMGFTFDDTAAEGVATPIAEMRRLIEKKRTPPRMSYSSRISSRSLS